MCQDIEGNEASIPIEFTNLNKPNMFKEQADGRCDFSYNELLKLVEFVEVIQKMSN